MIRKPISFLFLMVFLPPVIAYAVSEKDFEVQTTKNIVNLCTVSPDDPLYHQAINFCHLYLVGAYHYYEAVSSGPKGIRFVCPPDPMPTRNDAIDAFIQWVKVHPQYWGRYRLRPNFAFSWKSGRVNRIEDRQGTIDMGRKSDFGIGNAEFSGKAHRAKNTEHRA